jgi:hypothetical protein
VKLNVIVVYPLPYNINGEKMLKYEIIDWIPVSSTRQVDELFKVFILKVSIVLPMNYGWFDNN